MKPWRRSTAIGRRLTRITVLASGTALLLAGAALIVYDFVSFRTAMVGHLSVEAQIIGSNTLTALTFDDSAAAVRTLGALRAEPHIEAAALYRPNGDVFAEYYRPGESTHLELPTTSPGSQGWSSFERFRAVHVVRQVLLDGAPIGLVYIRSDLGEANERLGIYGLIVGIVLGLALLAAQLVSRVSRRAISQPITELAALATKLSADKDYSVRATPSGEGELAMLIGSFNEMVAQIQARDASLLESHDLLEQRVLERTAALDASNKELEAFCYSVSHDLRSPLRAIDGFSQALLEDLEGQLDASSASHLLRIRAATQRMGALIDDLLNLSRITRGDLSLKVVDLSVMARAVTAELAAAQPGRTVEVVIEDGLAAVADPRLIRQVLENLIGNAWKFSSKRSDARIEFGVMRGSDNPIYFVKDNGAGFDSAYADRLFGVFQRLHAMTDFPGTGVGLAIVERIVHRHGGRVWAESAIDQGATFYFTLVTVPEASAAAS